MVEDYKQMTLSRLRVKKDYWIPKEVSELYHVSTQTVCAWCRSGVLKADKRETVSKNAKGDKHRWYIFPEQIEEIETIYKEDLIEASRKYWMREYVKVKKRK